MLREIDLRACEVGAGGAWEIGFCESCEVGLWACSIVTRYQETQDLVQRY